MNQYERHYRESVLDKAERKNRLLYIYNKLIVET